MSDDELIALAKRGQLEPETLTLEEIRELALSLLEPFQPVEPEPSGRN